MHRAPGHHGPGALCGPEGLRDLTVELVGKETEPPPQLAHEIALEDSGEVDDDVLPSHRQAVWAP